MRRVCYALNMGLMMIVQVLEVSEEEEEKEKEGGIP